MSDTQNPVEETPVAALTTEVPAEVTATPAVEGAAEHDKEGTKDEAKAEVSPASEGVLEYKGPGLKRYFSKRYFFYFSEEAVECKHLSHVPHTTVAWANQTGKGLLFYAKRAEDKTTPAGVYNLSEITELAKDGSDEFAFKVNGQKHVFHATSSADRDSWLLAVESKAAEATAEKEKITSNEGYQAELDKLGKPATTTATEGSPKKSVEKAKEAIKDAAAVGEEKSRSHSRKRTSIFGSLLGRKETEEKKETKEDTSTEPVTETVAADMEAPTEAAGANEPAADVAGAEASDDKEEAKNENAAAPKAKRSSIMAFGNLLQKVTKPHHEKESNAAKETTVSSTAPQLENPVDESTIEPDSVTAPTESAESPKEEKKKDGTEAEPAAASKEKRRLFGGKKDKKTDSSEGEVAEGEPKLRSKLGTIFRRNSKAVKAGETKKEKEPLSTTEPVAEDDKPEPIAKDKPTESALAEPVEQKGPEVPAETVNVASTAATVQAAA